MYKEDRLALSNIFQKQDVMRRVCYSLIPIFIYSIFLYGIHPIYQVAVSFIVGIGVEYIFEKHRNKKVSEAVYVTCFLYGLSLPPLIPIWMNMVGIAFAVFIAKCVFGGFGRNVYNPAITGRLFVYISFPLAFTTQSWLYNSSFAQTVSSIISSQPVANQPDAVSVATPLSSLAEGEIPSLINLFFGFRTGSIGEGAIFLIIIAGIYLVVKKVADWRPMVSTLLSASVLLLFFYYAGLIENIEPSSGGGIKFLLAHLMSGSILYMIVFMTTDPVTSPNNKISKWYYGIIIGTSTVLIRLFTGFPEGVSFAIMIGNTFACLLDEIMAQRATAKKAKLATSTSIIIMVKNLIIKKVDK